MYRRKFLKTAAAASLAVLGAVAFPESLGNQDDASKTTGESSASRSPASRDDRGALALAGYADAAFEALMDNWYQAGSGSWRDLGWWNTANALETVVNYSYERPLNDIRAIVLDVYDNMRTKYQPSFIDDFYDDEGWWALALLRAYDRVADPEFLRAAKTIFDDILAGWDEDVCGGGIWWSKKRNEKNAIENELFITLAARLYARTNDESYLRWSERAWTWFDQIGLQGPNGLINDGVNLTECDNNGEPAWTYNQGVILGGLSDLYSITGDYNYLRRAEEIAIAAMNQLVDEGGVLVEPCESTSQGCGDDGTQFKGIFVRYLSYAYSTVIRVAKSPQSTAMRSEDARFLSSCESFFVRQAQSIWSNNRDGSNNTFGVHWAGPFTGADASTQSSALDALVAAVSLT